MYYFILELNLKHYLINFLSVLNPWSKGSGGSVKSVKGSIVRRFKNSPKKIGPKSKLSGREEFLLCLIKIRLGLLHEDLAKRFSISKTLASRIFSTWVKATAAVLKSHVFVSKMENIVPSRPNKFSKFFTTTFHS